MEARLLKPESPVSGLDFVMAYHAEYSRNQQSEHARHESRTSANSTSMVPVDPLAMDAFNESFPPMTELNAGSMFVSKQKTTEIRNFVPGNAQHANRITALGKGPSLVGGFGADVTSLSSFDVEYALLEQALSKVGGTAAPSASCALQARSEPKGIQSLLEPEFYFSDILGDNGVPPQPLTIKSEENDDEPSTFQTLAVIGVSKRPQERETMAKQRSFTTNPALDPDFSPAVVGLAYAEVSRDFRSVDGIPNASTRYQTTFSNVTRDHEEHMDGHDRFIARKSSSSRNSSSTNVAPFGLSDLQNCGTGNLVTKQKKGSSETRHVISHGENRINAGNHTSLLSNQTKVPCNDTVHSPISDSSMSGIGIGTHPDLYENLSPEIREKVDNLQSKISVMPRRKLRESLAKGVSIDEVEPLMSVNRDELAGMLGLGVTTWKMFVHHTLGIPRWPARALKSQKVKEKKLLQKKLEAERRGEFEVAERVQRELLRMAQAHMKRRKLFRSDVKLKPNNFHIAKN